MEPGDLKKEVDEECLSQNSRRTICFGVTVGDERRNVQLENEDINLNRLYEHNIKITNPKDFLFKLKNKVAKALNSEIDLSENEKVTCKMCYKESRSASSDIYREMDYLINTSSTMYCERHANKQYECVVCRHVFPQSHNLLQHQRNSHRVPIDGMLFANKCELCHKMFSTKSGLKSHMRRHKSDGMVKQSYLCDVCGKQFNPLFTFEQHFRIHTGCKPFKCNFCQRMFRKQGTLIAHTRIHTGEKPYCCKECGKCFVQIASLKIHQRYHMKEKPFKCMLCNMGFVYKSSLNVHMGKCTVTSD